MTISELCKHAHANARDKGFWEDQRETGTMLMLIVSELGEAMEALRHGDFLNFDEELADVMIRMGDMCGGLGIDLEYAIEKKMAVNAKRPHKHGKQF